MSTQATDCPKSPSDAPATPSDAVGSRSRDGSLRTIKQGSHTALVFLVLLLGAGALLFRETSGHFTPPQWAAFYVIVALTTGIAFWVLTPGSSARFSAVDLGIRLGGGAGIGAAFMVLASLLADRHDSPEECSWFLDGRWDVVQTRGDGRIRRGWASIDQTKGESTLTVTIALEEPRTNLTCKLSRVLDDGLLVMYYDAVDHSDKGVIVASLDPHDRDGFTATYSDLVGTDSNEDPRGSMTFTRAKEG